MAFRTGANATVWEITPNAKYTDVRLSTSRRVPDTEPMQFETDFSGFVRMIGDAHTMAAGLKPKDRIQLGDVSATYFYDREKKVGYYNFQCFNFGPASEFSQNQTYTQAQTQTYTPAQTPSATTRPYNPAAGLRPGQDENLPFN